MDLEHRFTVPTSVDETWAHFQDLEALAECFPGATVSSVEGNSFTGSAKVKLGPIALVYNGSGSITERDESAHRMLVEAKGKDKRGNGTAGATVTLTMADAGGSTDVQVVTDLAVTGKPAQFGRGVMQDVSDKLLGQFVSCLEQRLAGDDEPVEEAAPAGGASATSGGGAQVAGTQPAAAASAAAASTPSAGAASSAGSSAASSAGSSAAPPRPAPVAASDDVLDLGAAVLPVLAKTYWKQALGLVVGLVLLRKLLGGRG